VVRALSFGGAFLDSSLKHLILRSTARV
jgi:hypothetical protein